MTVLDRLIDLVPDVPVQRVLVGCFTTLVQSGQRVGIASTLKPSRHSGAGITDPNGLMSCSLRDLARRATSGNLLDASLGMAAIHGGTADTALPFQDRNARDILLELGKDRVLGMIGHFPFLDRIRHVFRSILVFELEPEPGDLPASEIPSRLPEADIVAVTATTLTNHTFDTVMGAVRPGATVIMLGPTTPLHPLVFDSGVDVICGSMVTDPETAFRLAACGTPFRRLSGIRHVTVSREDLA